MEMHSRVQRRMGALLGRRTRVARVAIALGAVAGIAGSAPALALTPGRAYELVSHGDDNLGDVVRVTGASNLGDMVAYLSTSGTDVSNASLFHSATLASRSASGWTLTGADPVTPAGMSGFPRNLQPLQYSSDFSRVLVQTGAGLDEGDDDDTNADLYLVDIPSGAFTWVTHTPGQSANVQFSVETFLGASADLSHVYFRMRDEVLVPGAPNQAVYEYDNGNLRVASVLPDDTSVDGIPVAFPHDLSSFGTSGGNGATAPHGGAHAVSDDGTRFFFSYTGPSDPGPGLYVRENGTTTKRIGLSQKTGSVGQPATGARFLSASPDGSVVYFMSDDDLTDQAPAGGGLYRYDIDTDALDKIVGASAAITDGITSNDASTVYFVSSSALAPGSQAGQPNAYVFFDGDLGYIATFPSGVQVKRVSQDGAFAIFSSTDSLAGADANNHVTLYLWDDDAGALSCVSCRLDGSASQADATLEDLAAGNFGVGSEFSSPRNISDDGRVFFASRDQLVTADANQAYDVYEYADGQPWLLSSGHSGYDSFVEDNTDDGTNAYFVTAEGLLADDRDGGAADLYDARVGGGFPVAPAPARGCDLEDCQQGVGTPSLVHPGSTSATAGPSVPAAGESKAIRRGLKLLTRISAADRARLARGRSVALAIRVTGGGRVTLSAKARMGRQLIAAGSAARTIRSQRTTIVHLNWRLPAAARAALRRQGRARITLSIKLAGASGVTRRTFTVSATSR